jgi:hypothetical protein
VVPEGLEGGAEVLVELIVAVDGLAEAVKRARRRGRGGAIGPGRLV